ncbi:MAG: hypothetical protein QXN56_04900, partial [Candidatus Hadarchaeum sp.]
MTNNRIELYYRITQPQRTKKRFKTKEGLEGILKFQSYSGNAMLESLAGSGIHCDYNIAYVSTKVDVSPRCLPN